MVGEKYISNYIKYIFNARLLNCKGKEKETSTEKTCNISDTVCSSFRQTRCLQLQEVRVKWVHTILAQGKYLLHFSLPFYTMLVT